MVATAATGSAPMAVSPDSMRALDPSKPALATSLTSARPPPHLSAGHDPGDGPIGEHGRDAQLDAAVAEGDVVPDPQVGEEVGVVDDDPPPVADLGRRPHADARCQLGVVALVEVHAPL